MTLERDKENTFRATTWDYVGRFSYRNFVKGHTVSGEDGIAVDFKMEHIPTYSDDDEDDGGNGGDESNAGNKINEVDESGGGNEGNGDNGVNEDDGNVEEDDDECTVLKGNLDITEGSIRGEWSEGGDSGHFVFKRSPESMRFYPSPGAIHLNPARARWNFALEAVRYAVRRDSWSKSFFMDRFSERKRYMYLAIRQFYLGKELDSDLNNELYGYFTRLTTADIRFYTSLIDHKLETETIHLYVQDCLPRVLLFSCSFQLRQV
jgi:hypothetical protein